MLNNPNWDKTIKLDNFIAWLREQPSDTTYEWESGETCLMGQYLQAAGMHDEQPPMPNWYEHVTLTRPWTFDAALKRAEAIR